MIKAVLYKSLDGYSGFELSGHAEYADEGSDIVCAAASAFAQFAIAGIAETGKIACGYEVADGRIYLTLPKELEEEDRAFCEGFLETLKITLSQLSQQYNDYLNFTVMEV